MEVGEANPLAVAAVLGMIATDLVTKKLDEQKKELEEQNKKLVQELKDLDKDGYRYYYRGLSWADMNEYELTRSISAKADRDPIGPGAMALFLSSDFSTLAKAHGLNSKGSAFVGVTTNKAVALRFAREGKNPSYFMAIIRTNRAMANPYNTAQEEYLLAGAITSFEIVGVVNVGR